MLNRLTIEAACGGGLCETCFVAVQAGIVSVFSNLALGHKLRVFFVFHHVCDGETRSGRLGRILIADQSFAP